MTSGMKMFPLFNPEVRDTLRLRLNGFGPPFRGRFATVLDRFSGSWCRFLESWGPDGENGEKTGKNGEKMGEKWPKESGGKWQSLLRGVGTVVLVDVPPQLRRRREVPERCLDDVRV